MKYIRIIRIIICGMAIVIVAVIFSCSDFVNVDPPRNEITTETIFTDDASATSTVMGIYSEMIASIGFVSGNQESIYVLSGLSADEFRDLSGSIPKQEFYYNALTVDNATNQSSLWGAAYTFIYYANTLLEGLEGVAGVTEEVKLQLEGEAKFIRAFCYFYLVNLYGGVPVITGTDFEVNRLAPRDSKEEVYKQIITDLQDARELLIADYSFSNGERVRPNQGAATALLARVYLYTEDWSNAEAQATLVIDNSLYHLTSDLDGVFQANSEEAIWQLKPVAGNNTFEAGVFIPVNETSRPGFVSLTDALLTTFETEDDRRTAWIGEVTTTAGEIFYYPFKYKVNDANAPATEYSMVLRLAEQYLIRAEARVQQGDIAEGLKDINGIRNRAGLGDISGNTKEELLDIIMRERRIELFSEGGHRWLDLKRTGKANAVLGQVKQDWQPTDVLYPIPQKEREANPNLTQNEGY